jgi:hypothetical protein
MLFSKYPKIVYNNKVIADLSVALTIPSAIRDNKDFYFLYEIPDGETADGVAYDFYGNSNYDFILFLMNNIVDPVWDWPMSQQLLNDYCDEKYPVSAVYPQGKFSVYYYINSQGEITLSNQAQPAETAAVSYAEYEEELNDKRRIIKILHPELLSNFKKEVETLVNR